MQTGIAVGLHSRSIQMALRYHILIRLTMDWILPA